MTGRRLTSLLLALLAILALLAPATNTAGAQNRVRAFHLAAPTHAGANATESPWTRPGSVEARARIAAGCCVAAKAGSGSIGGSGLPRFVSSADGIIDTASPALRKQVDDVADSILSTGKPPAGVRQGGLPGQPGVYGNKSGALPQQPKGYYTESDVFAGTGPRGTERIVVGRSGEVYYTPDHYGTFRRVR